MGRAWCAYPSASSHQSQATTPGAVKCNSCWGRSQAVSHGPCKQPCLKQHIIIEPVTNLLRAYIQGTSAVRQRYRCWRAGPTVLLLYCQLLGCATQWSLVPHVRHERKVAAAAWCSVTA
jgi:hypothetical protein